MTNNVIYLTKKRIQNNKKNRNTSQPKFKDKLTIFTDFSIIAKRNLKIKEELKKERELINRQVLKSYRIK